MVTSSREVLKQAERHGASERMCNSKKPSEAPSPACVFMEWRYPMRMPDQASRSAAIAPQRLEHVHAADAEADGSVQGLRAGVEAEDVQGQRSQALRDSELLDQVERRLRVASPAVLGLDSDAVDVARAQVAALDDGKPEHSDRLSGGVVLYLVDEMIGRLQALVQKAVEFGTRARQHR